MAKTAVYNFPNTIWDFHLFIYLNDIQRHSFPKPADSHMLAAMQSKCLKLRRLVSQSWKH